ncbi:hypothetical protein OED01_09400 [Microbacterium sp. M28]|uniref:hypothetical protein n=1 Tax=Microbacterium sp. M28 TaxID=2962064 RepID=UPI0021F4ECA3|nr:hypothetical protein [Microbacterium sp. M28]UYO95827.1 hypothetical protein OED01_09400 [Microbacterium sp. M28]
MTAVSLHHAGPTRLETALLTMADALTAYVAHRRDLRSRRRARELASLSERRSARDPRELDIALLALGSRPR